MAPLDKSFTCDLRPNYNILETSAKTYAKRWKILVSREGCEIQPRARHCNRQIEKVPEVRILESYRLADRTEGGPSYANWGFCSVWGLWRLRGLARGASK